MASHPAILLLAIASGLSAQWPQWRGPARDGSLPSSAQPARWPDRLTKLWEKEVGQGYSGPVVDSDRIWIHARRGGDEFVSCLRLATGEQLWTASYSSPFEQDHDAAQHGCGPFSTPALNAGRLFTFSINGVLTAWDAGTGKRLWIRGSAGEFSESYPYFGAAESPLVWRDLVFIHLGGHRRGKMETPGTGAIVALRVSDGREHWRWTGDGPAIGASPILCEFGHRLHLVYKTKKHIAGLDPASGKELWRIPYQVPMDNTITTPVCAAGRLITTDYDDGFRSWRIESSPGGWIARPSWRHRDVSQFNSSPVPVAGFLAGFSHFRKGQLFLLNPENGKVVWQGEPRAGEHASLISRGRELLVFYDDGTLLTGSIEREAFRPMHRYRLGQAPAWSHPALAETRFVYRHGARLVVYR